MLNNWLNPVNALLTNNSFFNVSFSSEDNSIPSLENIEIALIGILPDVTDKVRQHLGSFHNHFKNVQIADLGNCRKSDVDFITPLINELLHSGIIPILVGADVQLFNTVAGIKKAPVKVIANNTPSFAASDTQNVSYIGFQRHLVAYEDMLTLDERCANALSLGKLRSNVNLLEPLMRDTGIAYLHMNAMRSCDAPGVRTSCPSGLTTEELCQLMKYAGTSDILNIVMIDTDSITKDCDIDCKLIAEALWYLLEGVNARISDHPSKTKDCHEFLVSLPEIDADISFIKSNLTNKWWMKLPDMANHEVMYVACAYEEYQQSISEGEVPDRLMKFII